MNPVKWLEKLKNFFKVESMSEKEESENKENEGKKQKVQFPQYFNQRQSQNKNRTAPISRLRFSEESWYQSLTVRESGSRPQAI